MFRNKIFFILLASLIYKNSFANSELIFSIDLVRHGDRTPIYQIPRFPYYWKECLGELTERGINQAEKLGKQLRKRYVEKQGLLPTKYNTSKIYVRSTDYKRTIESAQSLLLGLYPPSTREHIAQQVPIHIVPKDKDNLLLVKPDNNIISKIKAYFISRNFWYQSTSKFRKEIMYWSEISNLPLNNFQQFDRLADYIFVLKTNHLPLPEGISNCDANKILSLGELGSINLFKVKEITHPTGREFIKTVVNYLKEVIQHKTTLKYILFLGHDSSILSVMNSLNSPLEYYPEYMSRLNFSLMRSKGNYYIKVTYNDRPVYIPNCKGNSCTLPQFEKLLNE